MIRLGNILSSACIGIAGVLLVFLIVTFGWLVFGRYVLNDTPTWVEQSSLLVIAWITFLGAAVGVRERYHLSIEFLRDALPPGPRKLCRIFSDATMLLVGGFMTWQGIGLVSANMKRMIPMLGMSESWRAFPLVICGILIVVFAAADLVKSLGFAGGADDPLDRPVASAVDDEG